MESLQSVCHMEKAVLGLMKFMKSKKVHVYSSYQLSEFYKYNNMLESDVSLCLTIMFGFFNCRRKRAAE